MIRRSLLQVASATLLAAASQMAGAPAALSAQVTPAAAPAAATDTVYEIRLRDGSTLFGRLVEESPARIVILTTGGVRVELERSQVASMRISAGRAVGGAYWSEDPNLTRLFFTSTARPLARGEGYVSSFMLFFPFVAYGFTERFTLAAGTPILPGAIGKLVYVAPKYTVVQRARTAFAIGALGFAVTEHLDDGSVGILYGAGTFGSTDRAITAGAGWGYAAGTSESGLSNDPVFMVGGETRVSRRVKLITENWMYFGGGGSGALVSGGLRFIGDRLSADLGFGGFTGTDVGCCIPIVNFVWNFGNRR
ncbi:MAG: hypothetical protein OEW77_00405 [Gemmatimonadota bacterium]|nr:hypothetical protein [Gemmatimonadota bacterium]